MSVGDAARAYVPEALFAAWLGLWIALAIEPLYRADWLLENLLVLGGDLGQAYLGTQGDE